MYKKCEEILHQLETQGKIKISSYEFPPKEELKLKLKDMLEDNVDKKYYLSDEQVQRIHTTTYATGKTRIQEKYVKIACETRYDEGIRTFKDNCIGSLRTIDACGNKCVIERDSIPIKENTKQGYKVAYEGDGINISSRMKYQRGNVQHEMTQTITTTSGNDRGVAVAENKWSDLD